MANHLAFKATGRPKLAFRIAVPYQIASIGIRAAFRAAVAFLPIVEAAPPAPPTPVPGPKMAPTVPFFPQPLDPTYGIDVLCQDDLDPYLSLTNALPQDIYHLVTEQAGALFWSSSNTFSVNLLLSQGITPAIQAQVQSTLQGVILADERVFQAQVVVSFDGLETLSVSVGVTPNEGQPFQFVLAINKVSITLISIGFVNL